MKRIGYFLLGLIIVAGIWYLYNNNGGGNGLAEQWESWLRIRKEVLGYDVLSVEASQAWIEKNRDEIHIPNQIEFGNPYTVSEIPFALYGITIAVDPKGNRRVSAREWPPEKTPLKIGDKLPLSFPVNVNIKWTGNNLSEFESYLKNETYNFKFVFEAKETYARTDIGGSTITYISPTGATIHYNVDRIITDIEGSVFKRQ